MLTDRKPLTLMIGPYVSVEDDDDGSCPSNVRRQLIELIRDPSLRELLAPLEAAANVGVLPPLLWQDHIATLCLLSGCSREEVASTIEQAVGAAGGDSSGPPKGLFQSVGTCVAARKAGSPGLQVFGRNDTDGLSMRTTRVDRSGVRLRACDLLFGANARPELHRKTYRPTAEQ
jgi:hypothetical protein